MSRRTILAALAVAAFSWSAAIAASPTASVPRPVAAAVYVAGSIICHQRPERSFHRDGAQLPVCARCLGLYAGASIGIVLWSGLAGLGRTAHARARRLTTTSAVRRALFITALPTLATVTTAWLGWWDAGNVLRAVFALPLGASIAAAVTAVAAGDLR